MNYMKAAMDLLKQRVGSYESICMESTALRGIRHGQVELFSCFTIENSVYFACFYLASERWFFKNYGLHEITISQPFPADGKDLFDAIGLKPEFDAVASVPSSSWLTDVPRDGHCLWIKTLAISKKWVLGVTLEDISPPSLREFTRKLRMKQYAVLGPCDTLSCLFRASPKPVFICPSWLSWNNAAVRCLAQSIYDERDRESAPVLDCTRLAILADALQDAGCRDAALLDHLRGQRSHVRFCRVIDAILGLPPSTKRFFAPWRLTSLRYDL